MSHQNLTGLRETPGSCQQFSKPMEGASNTKRLLELDSSQEISPTCTPRTKMAHLLHSPPIHRNNANLAKPTVAQKSPQKMEESNTVTRDWMEEFMGTQLEKFNQRLNSFEQKIESTLNQELLALEQRCAQTEKTNEGLRMENMELRHRLLQVERDTRQLNFVASGIQFATPQEGYTKLKNTISTATNNEVRVTGIRILNMRDGARIVAKCNSLEDKIKIKQIKKTLSTVHADGTSAPIYINDDLPKPDREVQSRLNGIAKEMRKSGKDIRMGFHKLKVDGEWLHYNVETDGLEKRMFRARGEATNTDVERARIEKEKGGDRKLH